MDLLNLPSHAVILSGDSLSALETEALRCASHWLQTNSPEKHPDCLQLRPLNKMRQISIAQVRELITFVSQSSLKCGEKVCIIFEADRLQVVAANALLKTLEEPPAGTRFLLLTTSSEALLPTLRSRAQFIRLPQGPDNGRGIIWAEWMQLYRDWLIRAFERPKSTKDVADRVISVYQLLHRLDIILSDESLFKVTNVSASLTEEEEDAMQVCAKKDLQRDLLRQIAFSTKELFLASRSEDCFDECLVPLDHSLNILLKNAQLLEVNRSFGAIVENFLLHVARLAIF